MKKLSKSPAAAKKKVFAPFGIAKSDAQTASAKSIGGWAYKTTFRTAVAPTTNVRVPVEAYKTTIPCYVDIYRTAAGSKPYKISDYANISDMSLATCHECEHLRDELHKAKTRERELEVLVIKLAGKL